MDYITLESEELRAVIGNNEPGQGEFAVHRAGYNGVWSLTSVHAPHNCYVPIYAGLNLEHFMDDLFMTDEGGDIFEPRHLPMKVEQIAPNAVKLSHAASPLTGVQSETAFRLGPTHTLDLFYRATLLQPPRAGQRFGFFFASYINTPDFPALCFKDGQGIWNWLCPDQHGQRGGNTVCHVSVENPTFGDPARQYQTHSLTHSFSMRRFDPSLMFGRPGNGSMLYLQMFDQPAPLRLCMSPVGGGLNEDKRVYSPAWDFQYIIEHPTVGMEYRLHSRVIYKPYVDRDEVDRLYAAWTAELQKNSDQVQSGIG